MHGTFTHANNGDIEGYHGEIVTRARSSRDERNADRKKSRYILLAVPLVVILCGLLLYTTRSTAVNSEKATFKMSKAFEYTLPASTDVVLSPHGQLFMQATNEYGAYEGHYSFFAQYPGSQLIEPYKETTITLMGPLVDDGSYTFRWEIEGDENFRLGTVNTLTVTKTGLIPITFHAYDKDGAYVQSYETTLISKYVKRELRSLTEKDRDAFLEAAHKMWQYSTEQGRAMYGDKFTSIHTYTKEHALASGDIMCDQFHEGSGFLTHHLAISNSFEASLRSINPAVSLHYWDFTKEGEEISIMGKTASYLKQITPFLSDKWFGSVDSNNHIADSRWAHSKMPKIDASDGDVTANTHNSYGYMRSYWNNNPDPEVVRHLFDVCGVEVDKTIPNCAAHFELINAATFEEFMTYSPGDGHGPMHVQLGGVFGGCSTARKGLEARWGSYLDKAMTDEEIEAAGYAAADFNGLYGNAGQRRSIFNKSIMGEYFHIYRTLWRSHMCATDGAKNLLECPETCDIDAGEDCSCSVKKLTAGETTWRNLLPCFVENSAMEKLINGVFAQPFLEDLVTMMATSTTMEGEMLHAGSPADILFWVIHPTIERVLAAKRTTTVTKMGSAPFVKWAEGVDSDKNSWVEYSHYSINAGENVAFPEGYHCYGHAADDRALPDRLPYSDAILSGGADKDGDGHVSNWEFYLALDPNSVTSTDYVFDNFEWDHCA